MFGCWCVWNGFFIVFDILSAMHDLDKHYYWYASILAICGAIQMALSFYYLGELHD